MKQRNYNWISQEKLDAFVKEHNADPNQKCKILSIQTMRIYPKQNLNNNYTKENINTKTK